MEKSSYEWYVCMQNKGFTLIELMIVVGIIAVLVAIAVPSYQMYVMQANREAAEQLLLQNTQYMTRWYSENGTYLNGSSWPTLPYESSPNTGNAVYIIGFSSGTPSASSYTLLAQPICNTVQANDGCICVDQDANITESAPSTCGNSGACSCVP